MGNSSNRYNEDEKNLKYSYYDLIDKTLKKRYDKNRKDLFNQNYSLFAKDFKKSYINQKIVVTRLASYYIPWKSYLMRGLDNFANEKGYLWAKTLYDYVSNENFPEQNKYQNMFFYQEFEILSYPKIKNNNIEKTNFFAKNNELNDDTFDDINFVNENAIDPNDPLYSIKLRVTNNLMGSFISGGSGSPNSSLRNDPNYEYKYNKNKIKDYMEIFKEHLMIREHPIYSIIINFINDFIQYVNNTINFYEDNRISNLQGCQEKAEDIIQQLQDFIVLLQNVIKLFYSRSVSYAYFKDEKDEFLNLICFILFNSKKLYQKFFHLFELMNMEKIEKLKLQFELLGDLKPEDIGIKDKFCLNEKTNEFMAKLKTEKKNTKIYNKGYKNENDELAINVNGEEKMLDIKGYDDDISSSINNNEDKKSRTESEIKSSKNSNQEKLKVTSDSGKLNLFTKDFSILSEEKDYSKMPFGKAVEFIKKISDFKVPLEKLVIIASVSSLITECVNNYWKKMERFIQPSMLSIDADELMTIFIYIVYKSHMESLFVHGDFIKYFTSPTTKSTMIGYYYTTLQGCLDFLLEIKNKSEFITKESV